MKSYYKNVDSGSIYRTYPTKMDTGETSTTLERWNWDFENWSGHIHSYEETWKKIKGGFKVVPIPERVAKKLIGDKFYL